MELTSNDPTVCLCCDREGAEEAGGGIGVHGEGRAWAKAHVGQGPRGRSGIQERAPAVSLGGSPLPGGLQGLLSRFCSTPTPPTRSVASTARGRVSETGSAQNVVTDARGYTCRGAVPLPHWRPQVAPVTGKHPSARDKGPIGPCLVLRGEKCEELKGTR